MSQNACVSFPNSEQNTTLKESMINRLSNLINRNRSIAKMSQVLCSSVHAQYNPTIKPSILFSFPGRLVFSKSQICLLFEEQRFTGYGAVVVGY